ncbi:hypothetical protein EHQ58_05445 [Leptospira ognonensis]|uniref:PilZ domain-containing protein n=1 Tax=Leptospira ognonensis TaxID=2484945 RepID=A0A4R9K7D6_9LEPT|nr:hypothetical protein [Leptospira ognonensis]TGL61224.1 hypothetical protein EHQ58_05445 [Leptospira ognonensis]
MNLANQLPWIWPSFHNVYFFYIFLILLGAFIYARVMNFLQKKQKNVFSYWNEFQKFAHARKCNQAEINILKSFYDTLTSELAEQYLQAENRGKFKNALYRYFLSATSNPSEKEVDLFDKLFRSSQEFKKEITSLEDILVGEICALEGEGREELTHVMQKTNEELLLSSKALSKDFLVPGKEAKLYVFRPSSGGYLLSGIITKTHEKGVIFHFNGNIERKGEAHLMLLAKYSLIISPWPKKENEAGGIDLDKNKLLLSEENLDRQYELLKRISKEQSSGKSDKFKLPETARSFTALSERISDRGLTFEFPSSVSSEIWKVQDLWEVHFSFPDGPTIDVRGKMFPVKQKSELFLIRFVDADDTLRKTIYEEIKKRGGQREILS